MRRDIYMYAIDRKIIRQSPLFTYTAWPLWLILNSRVDAPDVSYSLPNERDAYNIITQKYINKRYFSNCLVTILSTISFRRNYIQWRSSAPKSGGHKLFSRKMKSKKEKRKKKVTAAFYRMIGYCE